MTAIYICVERFVIIDLDIFLLLSHVSQRRFLSFWNHVVSRIAFIVHIGIEGFVFKHFAV